MAVENLIKDLMRVLTPEEISELTSSSDNDSRIPLTDIINQKIDGVELDFTTHETAAKILPFIQKKKEEEQREVDFEIKAGHNVQNFIDHHNEMIAIGNTVMRKDGTKNETSTFILNEKKRFEYSQSSLKKKEVLDLYRKNSLVDIEQEKVLKEDLSKSSRSGILVNKKQF